ncbi:hypothetical protein VP01_4884g1 [Puccinia sorghi]|uniref:Uncharacterized protein n=1 Tax=Puccinia sorghi TaxID=27349 RepID=A0A0L6UM74_9BASI|nr:hypothetical protein VP01_4884g1 [Puccinia sorghi]
MYMRTLQLICQNKAKPLAREDQKTSQQRCNQRSGAHKYHWTQLKVRNMAFWKNEKKQKMKNKLVFDNIYFTFQKKYYPLNGTNHLFFNSTWMMYLVQFLNNAVEFGIIFLKCLLEMMVKLLGEKVDRDYQAFNHWIVYVLTYLMTRKSVSVNYRKIILGLGHKSAQIKNLTINYCVASLLQDKKGKHNNGEFPLQRCSHRLGWKCIEIWLYQACLYDLKRMGIFLEVIGDTSLKIIMSSPVRFSNGRYITQHKKLITTNNYRTIKISNYNKIIMYLYFFTYNIKEKIISCNFYSIGCIKYNKSTIRNESIIRILISSSIGSKVLLVKKKHVLKRVDFWNPVNYVMDFFPQINCNKKISIPEREAKQGTLKNETQNLKKCICYRA